MASWSLRAYPHSQKVTGQVYYFRVMAQLQNILLEVWMVTAEMSPYLLFGFLMAGVLSVFISPEVVERHLGRSGLRQVIKAAVLGVPLPLCSCSVLPVSASLRAHGAGRGATLSFLASTPQTGVDSIMVTHALLGPVVVLFRVVTAFVSGIVGGIISECVHDGDERSTEEQTCACCSHDTVHLPRWQRAWRYGFRTLPKDIGRAMLLGILLSGVLSALVPDNYFADRLGSGVGAMFIMLLAGIPLYVCSSGSVPIALALIRMGISPGAALVFLVSGPATNAAAITTIWKMLGRRTVSVYLCTIAVSALAAGWLLDRLATTLPLGAIAEACEHHHFAWWDHAFAVLLLIVLAQSIRPAKHKQHS